MKRLALTLLATVTLSACESGEEGVAITEEDRAAALELMDWLEDTRASGVCGGEAYDGERAPNAPDAEHQEALEAVAVEIAEMGTLDWQWDKRFAELLGISITESGPVRAKPGADIDEAMERLEEHCGTIMNVNVRPTAAAKAGDYWIVTLHQP